MSFARAAPFCPTLARDSSGDAALRPSDARTRLAAEDQEAASDTEVMLNLVAIYRSIGGAWKAV